MLSTYIEIGEVLKPQGIQGLVKVRPDTDDPERFLALSSVWAKEGEAYREVPVSEAGVRDSFVYLRLDGAADRNAAEKQRGWMLYVDRAHAKPLGEDEWFICDLVGCTASTEDGEILGEVTEIMQPGPNDVFVIRTKRGELLVPVLKRVLKSVDVQARSIVFWRERLREVALYE